VNDFDRSVIRQTIENFYVVQEIINIAVRERIHFHWGKDALHHILDEIGFP
jgi:hypothetical protein